MGEQEGKFLRQIHRAAEWERKSEEPLKNVPIKLVERLVGEMQKEIFAVFPTNLTVKEWYREIAKAQEGTIPEYFKLFIILEKWLKPEPQK